METILKVIEQNIPDKNIQFVFPSQVAADFWRKKTLESGAASAVRWDRFASWDSFKEELFALNRKELPVNSRIRRIFAVDILKRFSRGDIEFNSLLNPAFRETSGIFQGFLSGVLPHLKSFLEHSIEKPDIVNPDLMDDFRILFREYGGFMERFGLFEPSWVVPDMGQDDKRRVLFFPELIEDFDELAPQLAAGSEVELFPLSGITGEIGQQVGGTDRDNGDGVPFLLRYESSLDEARGFCLKAGELLDRGNCEIAVTLADKNILPVLKEQAVLYDIPLNFNMGASLGETAGGQFFSRIRECAEENFSLKSLNNLLINRAYPWKNERLIRDFILFGAENHCVRNIDRSPGGDLWGRMLKLAGEGFSDAGNLREFYSDLKKGITAITSAGSFSDLSVALELFLRKFLQTDEWEPEGLAVFQRCRRSLGELVLIEEKLAGVELPVPLDFLIRDLGSVTYVSRNSGGGIPVYAYRVSAGILPEYHFILGFSQTASQIQLPAFPFLRDDQRESLGFADRDFTGFFIDAYTRSGRNIDLSFSGNTLSGPQLPAGYFVVRGVVKDVSGASAADPYQNELDWWAMSETDFPDNLLPLQIEAASSGREIFHPRHLDFTQQGLSDCGDDSSLMSGLLKILGQESSETNQAEGEIQLKLSPYRMNSWAACPLFYLLQYGLGFGEIAREADWYDPLALGNLRHDMLFRFFSTLGKRRFDPSCTEEYKDSLNKTVEDVFAEWEGREPLTLTPFWDVLKTRAVAEVLSIIEAEKKHFSGFSVEELEASHECIVSGIRLSGRIDRVSQKDGDLAVIDYKARVNESLSSMFDKEGHPFSYQMPIYMLLLKREGRTVSSAAYFDLKAGKYKFMVDPAKPVTAEKMDRALEITESRLEDFRREVSSGEFIPPNDCTPCAFRFICRKRYVIKGGSRG